MGESGTRFENEFETRECFAAAVQAALAREWAVVDQRIADLARRSMSYVATEIAAVIEARIAQLWQRGWQPADVVRSLDRVLGKGDAVLVRRAIASEAQSYAQLGERVAPDWMTQLRRIGACPASDQGPPYLVGLGSDWTASLFAAVRVTCSITRLPSLPRLTDSPTEWRAGLAVATGSLPGRILDKVRALLAKAESTTFDAEAEAFTAKAQELMARHRIDSAVLDASSSERGEKPIARRIGIDDPYADAKAILLGRVADANDCRAVWAKDLGFTTVFGFASELDAVEELFTSLLVQATGALRRVGSKQDAFGRSRTKSFRRSFLLAFAVRIGQRLRDAVDSVVENVSVETGTALVPILAARAEETAAVARAAFPQTSGYSPRASDPEGWRAGTAFANQADLSVGRAPGTPELTRRSA